MLPDCICMEFTVQKGTSAIVELDINRYGQKTRQKVILLLCKGSKLISYPERRQEAYASRIQKGIEKDNWRIKDTVERSLEKTDEARPLWFKHDLESGIYSKLTKTRWQQIISTQTAEVPCQLLPQGHEQILKEQLMMQIQTMTES